MTTPLKDGWRRATTAASAVGGLTWTNEDRRLVDWESLAAADQDPDKIRHALAEAHGADNHQRFDAITDRPQGT
jgi:hypothetical protein